MGNLDLGVLVTCELSNDPKLNNFYSDRKDYGCFPGGCQALLSQAHFDFYFVSDQNAIDLFCPTCNFVTELQR